jgi:hypothetical protein
MDPFWENAYNDDKDKRYGALFFTALVGCFGSVAVTALIAGITASEYAADLLPAALVVVGIAVATLFVLVFRWFRGGKGRHDYLKNATLSRDELAKARSKLKRQMMSAKPGTYQRETRPSRRPPPRKIDAYVKY